MASDDGVGEDRFPSQAEIVRREIEAHFRRAHELLQRREADLLAELQRLAYEYSGDAITQQIKELSITKESIRENLKANENMIIFEQSSALIDARIKELETKLRTTKDTYESVSLEWEVELEQKLSSAGGIRIHAKNAITRDYRKIGDPISVFGRQDEVDTSPGVFCYAYRMAIHPDNNHIYICDGGNNRVQVFNKSFEIVSQFSERMKLPVGICIALNQIYVTQWSSNCLNVYSAGGEFLRSVGREGNDQLELKGPRGLGVSSDRARIYVAEYSNDRFQCLALDLTFIAFIDDIYGARDVKLTPNEIVLLSSVTPCVSLYSYSHQLIRQMIPRGKGNPIVDALSLFLDKFLNILITDCEMHCVCIFSFEGALIHKFGRRGEERGEFIYPVGIAVDNEGRILVASWNPKHCVQVF